MSKTPKIKKTILFTIITLVFVIPFFVYAVEYVPIEEIPLVGRQPELTNYLKGIFQFGVAAIAIVSMLTIMIGGYLYIFSGGSEGVKKAKTMIVNALLGLGLALVSWIIVYTINPDLIELKGIRSVKIDIKGSGGGIEGNINDVNGAERGNSVECAFREVSWEKANISEVDVKPLVMQFNLSESCITESNGVNFYIQVVKETLSLKIVDFLNQVVSLVTAPLDRREYIDYVNFSKAQLKQNPSSSFIWEASWDFSKVRDKIQAGDKLFFIAQNSVVKNAGEQLKISPIRASNVLEILSIEEASGECKIKQLMRKVESNGAELVIPLTPTCYFKEIGGTENKYNVDIEFYGIKDNGARATIKNLILSPGFTRERVVAPVTYSEINSAKITNPDTVDWVFVNVKIFEREKTAVIVNQQESVRLKDLPVTR